jgi:hypothetical protein
MRTASVCVACQRLCQCFAVESLMPGTIVRLRGVGMVMILDSCSAGRFGL